MSARHYVPVLICGTCVTTRFRPSGSQSAVI